MNRRGFLGLLAASIAGATLPGIKQCDPNIPPEYASGEMGRYSGATVYVHARHLYCVDLGHLTGEGPIYWHRIDLIHEGQQIGVDFRTMAHQLDQRELEPALAALDTYLEDNGVRCRVGELYTFSIEEWDANTAARAKWGKLGQPNAGRLA